jgi:microcompartment protein CcmL/EutN
MKTQYQQALKHHERQIGGMVLTLCIPNTHKDTKALSKPSNSDANNRKYTNKQACKQHTSKKTAQHNDGRSY